MSYGDPKPKWHNLKFAAPTAMLFVSPWMHKALYENFMAACPGLMEPANAHVIIWAATATAWMFTFLWAVL